MTTTIALPASIVLPSLEANQTAKLRRKDVARLLEATFPSYAGRKITVEARERYFISSAQLNWDDGALTEVTAARCREDGTIQTEPFTSTAPWDGKSYGGNVPDDVLLVEHSFFMGKDQGIRIVCAPSSKFLPRLESAPRVSDDVEASVATLRVLEAPLPATPATLRLPAPPSTPASAEVPTPPSGSGPCRVLWDMMHRVGGVSVAEAHEALLQLPGEDRRPEAKTRALLKDAARRWPAQGRAAVSTSTDPARGTVWTATAPVT